VVEAEHGQATPVKTWALRSYARDLYSSKQAPHLLPVQCIICKHETYKVQKHSRKMVIASCHWREKRWVSLSPYPRQGLGG